MQRYTKYKLIILIFAIVAVCSSFFSKPYTVAIPKGWPKPIYTFKNNAPSEFGFKLGRKLFYDPILSRDGTISCASCHSSYSSFTHTDHAVSHGIEGRVGTRNALVLVNLIWNTSFMYDGGINHLEVQPLGPIAHHDEMDFNLKDIVVRLDSSEGYRKRFQMVFGDSKITGERVLKAMAQFTGQLISADSKYDKYVKGDAEGAFTDQEIKGLTLFRKHCSSCHPEPLFTDYSFRNIGLAVDTFYNDMGRMKITGKQQDSLKFRVPTLRNIAVSFPYMHDGRFKTIRQVLNHYTSAVERNKNIDPLLAKPMGITDSQKVDITAFLMTLTDRGFIMNERYRFHADD